MAKGRKRLSRKEAEKLIKEKLERLPSGLVKEIIETMVAEYGAVRTLELIAEIHDIVEDRSKRDLGL